MGKREAANDPNQDPTDEAWRSWKALHDRRKDEAKDPLKGCPRGYHEINIAGHEGFCGRWLLQYFDLALGKRYSIGSSPDGRFFVLCLYDSDQHTTLDWFPNEETIYLSLDISKDKWMSIASFANKESK